MLKDALEMTSLLLKDFEINVMKSVVLEKHKIELISISPYNYERI